MNTKTALQNSALRDRAARGTGTDFGNSAVPMEPSIVGRAQELLNHIGNLEREHSVLRGALFGEGADAEGRGPIINSGLEAVLADACTRVACMVGDMATINGKVTR